MTINVEFLAGTDIKVAIAEAKEKACMWDVAYISFKFNGVDVNVQQSTDVDSLVAKFHKALESTSEHNYIIG